MFDYSKVNLSEQEVAAGEFKKYLGGGAQGWELRGAFQVALMQWLGMSAERKLLDVGCGPLRAGMHFIKEYGDRYRGVDFNQSFISAGHKTLENSGLSEHKARVSLLTDFSFGEIGEVFDFVLCFSVLNHCSDAHRTRFFENLRSVMGKGARVVITHGSWLKASTLKYYDLCVEKEILTELDLPEALRFDRWGFDGAKDRLPIYVLRSSGPKEQFSVVSLKGGHASGLREAKPTYVYFGHHKCGSRWVASVLQDVCELAGLKFGRVGWRQQAFSKHPMALQAYIDEKEIDVLAYINANYYFVPAIRNLRGFHVVRDPRDVCVSAYYSHCHSHPIRDWIELGVLREKLQRLPKDDGLLIDMQFSKWIFDDMRTWKYDNPEIFEAQLECAIASPYDFFERALTFMGLFPFSVTREQLQEIVSRYDFRKLSGGRSPGDEDVLSHYRRGMPGDWRQHFKDEHLQYFLANYGAALQQAGYAW